MSWKLNHETYQNRSSFTKYVIFLHTLQYALCCNQHLFNLKKSNSLNGFIVRSAKRRGLASNTENQR